MTKNKKDREKVEYRIVGRFRKDAFAHPVDWNPKWTLEDASKRLAELIRFSEKEMGSKKRMPNGLATVEYCSDYDLLELRIQSRVVTKWIDE